MGLAVHLEPVLVDGCQGLVQLGRPQEFKPLVRGITARFGPQAALHLTGLLPHESGQLNARGGTAPPATLGDAESIILFCMR